MAIVLAALVAGAIIAVAFGRDGDESTPQVQVEWLATVEAAETAGMTPPASPTSSGDTPATSEAPTEVRGFAFPISGGCLPQSDDLMPGAERAYRKGIHEGVDFYNADNCTPIGVDTEVHAAKAGTVIRADWDYHNLTADELNTLLERINGGDTDPAIEDAFRGRQVWIDHGDGTTTRYAHLNGVAAGITPGVHVEAGDLIAYVGESGTPESVTNPGTEFHLHFEIRVGEHFLGQGLPPEEVRRLYEQAFSP